MAPSSRSFRRGRGRVARARRRGVRRLLGGLEVALCDLALGQALMAIGRSEDALAVLTRAAGVFEQLHVPRELETARALLGVPAPTD